VEVEDAVAVGAGQLRPAVELAHGAVADGDVIVAGAVVDPGAGAQAVDDVAAQVDSDAAGPDEGRGIRGPMAVLPEAGASSAGILDSGTPDEQPRADRGGVQARS